MNDLLGYRTIFGQDTTIWKSGGAKKAKYWENLLKICPNEVLSNEYYNQKSSFDIVMVEY